MSATAWAHGGDLFRALRPRQWVKNGFVFAALVFGDRASDPAALLLVFATFVVFCALSSSVYLLNDIADREADRLHPVKRHRGIAARRVSVREAAVMSLLLALGALAAAAFLDRRLVAIAVAYLVLNLAYSLWLKQVVILDVMLVAAGFLLRAAAGAVVLDIEMSNWLVLCTALIALFLALIKRRQEFVTFQDSERQRASLRDYSLPFLDQMITILSAATIVTYCLYAFSPEVTRRLGTRAMGFTIPFVLFGIFRYLYLVHRRGEGENPTALVLRDPPLRATILLWGATVIWVLYAR